MDEHTNAQPATDRPPGRRLGLAVVASLLVHGLFGAVIAVGGGSPGPARIEPPPFVDIELAPQAPLAELLPTERRSAPPEQDPVATPPPEPEPDPDPAAVAVPQDAGVDARRREPADAREGITEQRDAGVADAGVAVATADHDGGVGDGDGEAAGDDAGAPGPARQVSAGTAANLLAYFPSSHVVTVMLRFDRLRGTEWAKVAQEMLSVMPDYGTLIADPSIVVADAFDLVAMSSPAPRHAIKTTLAVKSALPQAQLRAFLDAPGAPVRWSRVVGGVLGTRIKGKRTAPGDDRVFLSPQAPWMVLARPRELDGLLTAAQGDLDGAIADPAVLPGWLQRLAELEAASGIPDGPALMMTLAPKATSWEVPDIGLGVREVPAPERMTMTLEIDPQGFLVRGNLRFRSQADAETFVTLAESARQTALGTDAFAFLLKRAKAFNGVKGLSLVRTDQRVAYATSISIADARVLMAAGTQLVAEMFQPQADDPP